MPSPVEQRKVDRFVELVGAHGLLPTEASRAVQLSERTGERLMTRPDVRGRIEELRAKSEEGLLRDVRETIDDLLAATDKDGNEDWTARARGAEMLMRHQEQFEEHEIEDAEGVLPEGVYRVYPRVPRET